MKKLWLILPFILLTTLIFAFESDRWGRSATTSARVSDSCNAVRSEIDDSIVVFADTMEANPVLVNDLKIIDSLQVPLWEAGPATGAVGMFGADTTNDSLFLYLPGGKTALYPQASAGAMSGGDILDSLNDAARSVSQAWTFTTDVKADGGNIIAADGQKFIATDDSEADTFSVYVEADTIHLTGDNVLRIGGAGTTTVDSLEVQGVVEGNFQVRDSLIIPTYAAFPATGSEGLIGADSANDSLIAYWGGARQVIYPSSGGSANNDWVWLISVRWLGGNESNNTNVCYYSSGANVDTFWSFPFTFPIENEGSDIILDSLIYNYRNEGVEDSSKAFLQKITNMVTFAHVDSASWNTGTTAYLDANIIENGDYTILDGVSYRVIVVCRNNGGDDLRVGYHLRAVCHK